MWIFFKEDQIERRKVACIFSFPKLSTDRLDWLGRPISFEEIREAIFNIGALKAPGPDGFNALLY